MENVLGYGVQTRNTFADYDSEDVEVEDYFVEYFLEDVIENDRVF